MKSRKLIGVYTGLLIIAVATMIMLWRLKTMPKAEVFPRDYPEIKEEGILRLVTEYNQSGYYVAGDTIEGFQYELSQAIAQLSGLEIQIFFFFCNPIGHFSVFLFHVPFNSPVM